MFSFLSGCLPTLATIPVWIGLYRALSNVANEVLQNYILVAFIFVVFYCCIRPWICCFSHVLLKGLLTEGFFWIPSLAGPTTIASRQNGSGISWLFPFIVSPLWPLLLFWCWPYNYSTWCLSLALIMSLFSQDGHPPLGWSDTAAYLVLPLLLVISQYISVQIMQSSQVRQLFYLVKLYFYLYSCPSISCDAI